MQIRLDRLLGRPVLAQNGRRIGRIEEFRAERNGDGWFVREYVIGGAGLVERLHLAIRLLVGGRRQRGFVARWDQLDVTQPERPRLRCPSNDLREL
jgi:hypothetical protein